MQWLRKITEFGVSIANIIEFRWGHLVVISAIAFEIASYGFRVVAVMFVSQIEDGGSCR